MDLQGLELLARDQMVDSSDPRYEVVHLIGSSALRNELTGGEKE